MTVAEKIEMYKRKKQFVNDISNVLSTRAYRMGIMYVDYEIIANYECDDLHDDIISYWSKSMKRDFGFDIRYRFYIRFLLYN